MSQSLMEFALLEDVRSLPAKMQKIYLQLVSAIDYSLQKLRIYGASPDHMTEEFIEDLVNLLMDHSVSKQALQQRVHDEFLRQILEQTEMTELTSVC